MKSAARFILSVSIFIIEIIALLSYSVTYLRGNGS